MMDFSNELATLGQTAATSLVQAMVSDGWQRARSLFVRLLGRGDGDEVARHEGRLDRDRAVLDSDPGAEEWVRQQWMTRIADWLEEHPESIEDLKELLRVIQGERSEVSSRTTFMQVQQQADHESTAFVAGGDVTINHGANK